MKNPFKLGVALCAVLLQGCNINFNTETVHGSGVAKTETREVASFDKMSLAIGADVDIKKGDAGKIIITADENLLPLITTEVSQGALTISDSQGFSSKTKIRISLETPTLSKADIRGSGNVHLEAVTDQVLEAVISGSGNIEAVGTVASLNARIDGSGDLKFAKLQAQHADVRINGSGNVQVFATDFLDARINGSGDIEYQGEPKTVNSKINGSGRISRKN